MTFASVHHLSARTCRRRTWPERCPWHPKCRWWGWGRQWCSARDPGCPVFCISAVEAPSSNSTPRYKNWRRTLQQSKLECMFSVFSVLHHYLCLSLLRLREFSYTISNGSRRTHSDLLVGAVWSCHITWHTPLSICPTHPFLCLQSNLTLISQTQAHYYKKSYFRFSSLWTWLKEEKTSHMSHKDDIKQIKCPHCCSFH